MHYGDNSYFSESFLISRSANFSAENYLSKSAIGKLYNNLREQKQYYNVFISHSAKDKSIIQSIVDMIEEKGFSAYVDWLDDSESQRNNIAKKIKIAINKSNKLLYVHTHNSIHSKWTPWEIGCFDSLKGLKKIAILPLLSDQGKLPTYSGQEYLQQYDTISKNYLFQFLRT